VINVQEFGTKGDGLSDDTAALQAVFDRVGQSRLRRGVIYLPNGTYLVNGQATAA